MVEMRVTIFGGFNLLRGEHGDNDLYVKVKCGHHDEKTRKKEVEGANCLWNETLSISHEAGKSLVFQLRDKDLLADDTIGEGELSPMFFETKDWEGEIPLTKHGEHKGILKVRVNNPMAIGR